MSTPACGDRRMQARRSRLAIVVSHPIQYYSPWFQHLAAQTQIDVRVFYLWDFGVRAQRDRDFGQAFTWDIDLLDGYAYEFVPNRSADPGTHHFRGLDNPELVDRLARWQPDSILLYGYSYLSHLRLLLSWRLRSTPILFRGDSHNVGRPRSWRTALSRAMRRLLFRRYSAFLAVGSNNIDYLIDNGAARDRIHLAPHFVDNERFAATDGVTAAGCAWRTELGVPQDAVVFLFAGKLEPKKRPLDLLDAWRLASRKFNERGFPRAVLLFVGSGELEPRLRTEAACRPFPDVLFVPFQNQSNMPRVYAAADALVLPSMNGQHGYETWGLAVNEAMSAGTPAIVSSHVGCAPDLIRPGETGWVFPAGDVVALSETLLNVLEHSAQLPGIARAAQRHIAAFSCETATRALIKAMAGVDRA